MGHPRIPGVIRVDHPSMPRSYQFVTSLRDLKIVPSCSRHCRAGLWLCRPFGTVWKLRMGHPRMPGVKGWATRPMPRSSPICAVPSGLGDCSFLFPALPCRAMVVSSLRDCLEAQDGAASDSGS